MKLTREILEAGRSKRGAWNGKQFALLGLKIQKLPSGWMADVIGKEFSKEKLAEFVELKDQHLAPDNPSITRMRKMWFTKAGRWKLAFEPNKLTRGEAEEEFSKVLDAIDDFERERL